MKPRARPHRPVPYAAVRKALGLKPVKVKQEAKR